MTTVEVATFDSLNPVNNSVLATYPIYSQDDVQRVVTSAQGACGGWRLLGFSGRRKVLLTWSKLLTDRIAECAALISSETGKPTSDATLEATLAVTRRRFLQ